MKKIKILLMGITLLFIIFLGFSIAKPPCWGSGEPMYAMCDFGENCNVIGIQCNGEPIYDWCYVKCICASGGSNSISCPPR
jgi:hypothetical protein